MGSLGVYLYLVLFAFFLFAFNRFIVNKIQDLDSSKYIYHIFLYFQFGRLKKTP